MSGPPGPDPSGAVDQRALDAYSQVVTAVAAELTPHVAAPVSGRCSPTA